MKKTIIILFSILSFSVFAQENALDDYNKKHQDFLIKREIAAKNYAAQNAAKRERDQKVLANARAYSSYVEEMRKQNGMPTARELQAQRDKEGKGLTTEGRLLQGFHH